MPRYREIFEKDAGYRFFRREVSILIQTISYGRRLDEKQNAALAEANSRYLDAIGNRTPLRYRHQPALMPDDFAQVSDQAFYKYISDETWEHIKRGSFQFGTASFYRSTPDIRIGDVREGIATFYLTEGLDQLSVSVVSGYNCALLCGTAGIGDRKLMEARFGGRLLRVEPVSEFAASVARRIGARSFRIHDIHYTDLKTYSLETAGIQEFWEIVFRHDKGGNLTERSLAELNRRFFHTLYSAAYMPSMFSKPSSYAAERERRIAFELPADLGMPRLVVTDPSLLQFVELA